MVTKERLESARTECMKKIDEYNAMLAEFYGSDESSEATSPEMKTIEDLKAVPFLFEYLKFQIARSSRLFVQISKEAAEGSCEYAEGVEVYGIAHEDYDNVCDEFHISNDLLRLVGEA